jgi:tellurite resistance protein TerC
MKRFVIAITGGTVVLLGIAMIALPGPAVVVIPAGLAILATEFLWARRALHRCKGMAAKARQNLCWLWFPRKKSNPANH